LQPAVSTAFPTRPPGRVEILGFRSGATAWKRGSPNERLMLEHHADAEKAS
jgi:hypothetical protein